MSGLFRRHFRPRTPRRLLHTIVQVDAVLVVFTFLEINEIAIIRQLLVDADHSEALRLPIEDQLGDSQIVSWAEIVARRQRGRVVGRVEVSKLRQFVVGEQAGASRCNHRRFAVVLERSRSRAKEVLLSDERESDELLERVEEFHLVDRRLAFLLSLRVRPQPANARTEQVELVDQKRVLLQQLDQRLLADLQEVARVERQVRVQIDDLVHLKVLQIEPLQNAQLYVLIVDQRGVLNRDHLLRELHQLVAQTGDQVLVGRHVGHTELREIVDHLIAIDVPEE